MDLSKLGKKLKERADRKSVFDDKKIEMPELKKATKMEPHPQIHKKPPKDRYNRKRD